jgi:hypothetical protein
VARNKRATARFAWTVGISAVVAGLTALLTDPNSTTTFLTEGPTPTFWRVALIIFLSGAIMGVKKYLGDSPPGA